MTLNKKKWNTLADVKHALLEQGIPIIGFNGWQLVTEAYIYGIVDGELHTTEVPKKVKKKTKAKKSSIKKMQSNKPDQELYE